MMQLTFPRSSTSDGNDVPNQPEFDKRPRRDVISIVNSSQRQIFVFAKSTISAARPLMTAFTARRCTAEIRRRKRRRVRRRYAGELNLTIGNAAIYCTRVEPDTDMVSLRCTLV
jgi:hypothetical protein